MTGVSGEVESCRTLGIFLWQDWFCRDACDRYSAKGWSDYEDGSHRSPWADDSSSFTEPTFVDNIRRQRYLVQHREPFSSCLAAWPKVVGIGEMKTVTRRHGNNLQFAFSGSCTCQAVLVWSGRCFAAGSWNHEDRSFKKRRADYHGSLVAEPQRESASADTVWCSGMELHHQGLGLLLKSIDQEQFRSEACDQHCAKGWCDYDNYGSNNSRWADARNSFTDPTFADNIRRQMQLLQHRATCQSLPGLRRSVLARWQWPDSIATTWNVHFAVHPYLGLCSCTHVKWLLVCSSRLVEPPRLLLEKAQGR